MLKKKRSLGNEYAVLIFFLKYTLNLILHTLSLEYNIISQKHFIVMHCRKFDLMKLFPLYNELNIRFRLKISSTQINNKKMLYLMMLFPLYNKLNIRFRLKISSMQIINKNIQYRKILFTLEIKF